MPLEHMNPAGMHKSPAFSQAIIVPAEARTMVIGGQNAIAGDGQIVGKDDLGHQAEIALDNLNLILESAQAGLQDLLKLTIYIADGQDIRPAFVAWMKRWSNLPNPPAIGVLKVAGFANPDFPIEIDALAVLP
jgi:enamine deaminase RidA (YjgF/YER057c/UK114 family)